jgi:diaminopimelate decarboxylase
MSVLFPRHAAVDGFDVVDGKVCVDGKNISDYAKDFGDTPFYLYSASAIRGRVASLRASLPSALHLHYAIKANPMDDVVALLASLVDGLDVASAGEIDIALRAGADASVISFAGPGKSDNELSRAMAAGVTINLESLGEMERLAALAEAAGECPKVAIRVNPAFELRQSGMKMGGGSKPFGVDEELVPDMLRRLADLPMEFVGFHIYAGSQGLDEDVLIDCHEKTIDLAIRLADGAPQAPRHVNIGGGYGIPYFPGDKLLSLDRLGDCLEGCLDRLKAASPETDMVMELGRFLVGDAGVYVSRVIDIKESRGETYVVTDGGLHHHLALSGNFGQVIRKNYPVAIADHARLPSDSDRVVSIVGRLCTPLDQMGANIQLPAVSVGDLVVVFRSGAYGASASPSQFLGHPAVREYLV